MRRLAIWSGLALALLAAILAGVVTASTRAETATIGSAQYGGLGTDGGCRQTVYPPNPQH